jgi:hypothetical protein
VRSDVFRAVGGFHEAYRNGLEDIDLCLKIRVAGHRIVYRGDITVIHHEGASRGSGASLLTTPASLASMRHNDELFISRWGPNLHQDDDLAALVWDAALRNQPPARGKTGGPGVLVIGQPSGIGPASEETRAILVALASNGQLSRAVDIPRPRVVARATGAQAEVLQASLHAGLQGTSAAIIVPTGGRDGLFVDGPQAITPDGITMVRLGTAETALDLTNAARVLAASRAVGAQLASQGLPTHKISVLPPMVEPRTLGRGGAGVLALLPTHDLRLTASLLAALAGLADSTSVRLIPTVFRRDLRAEIADRLPRAELLGPCSDEGRFAALAASADLVIAADPLDHFDRRALVAASVGTKALTLSPTGPASELFGAEAAASTSDLADALRHSSAGDYSRSAVQATVREACSQSLIAPFLSTPREP